MPVEHAADRRLRGRKITGLPARARHDERRAPPWPVRSRAYHLKGTKKPWATPCKEAKLGSFLLAPSRENIRGPVEPIDPLVDETVWHDRERECRSNRTQRLVLSASGVPIVARKCCVLYALLAGRWYAFLQNNKTREKHVTPV